MSSNAKERIKKAMKFSVLMSVYKAEKAEYLTQAINSILEQTVKPNEIVIVKDGLLTDELEKTIANFAEQNNTMKTISFKENRGLGLALRDGVIACTNEYIARMDTDDIAEKDRFEKQIKYLEENPEITIVGSWIKEFSKDINKPDTKTKLPCSNEEIKEYAKKRNPFRHMTVIFKKEAVIKSGNYRNFLWFEDYDLWIRMINKGYKAANIPEYLVNVRADEEMFARRGGWKYLKQDIKFQKYLLDSKFINKRRFLINVIIRSSVRLIPNALRVYIYKKFLRRQ